MIAGFESEAARNSGVVPQAHRHPPNPYPCLSVEWGGWPGIFDCKWMVDSSGALCLVFNYCNHKTTPPSTPPQKITHLYTHKCAYRYRIWFHSNAFPHAQALVHLKITYKDHHLSPITNVLLFVSFPEPVTHKLSQILHGDGGTFSLLLLHANHAQGHFPGCTGRQAYPAGSK